MNDANELGHIFGKRRRRACLGMPTDGGRRNEIIQLQQYPINEQEVILLKVF